MFFYHLLQGTLRSFAFVLVYRIKYSLYRVESNQSRFPLRIRSFYLSLAPRRAAHPRYICIRTLRFG